MPVVGIWPVFLLTFSLNIRTQTQAGSQEYAYEGLQGEENGVFTRSFIETIQEFWKNGRYGNRGENTIRVRDLRKRIYQKVSALTNGLQNPTSRQENGWWNWSF